MLNRVKNWSIEHKNYIILMIIIGFFIIVGYEYYYKYFYVMKDPEKLKIYVMSYGKYSILVFIAIQIIQVIAFFIPGEIVQIAGGYIFGTIIGSLISLVGITLGSIFVYLIANKVGKPFVQKLISQNKFDFIDKILAVGSKKIIIFLLYLIPGLPKDIFGYVCGVSNISLKDFAVYSTLGRIPGIYISAYFGSQMFSGNIHLLVLIAVTMSILFIVGMLKGDRIIRKIMKKHKKQK